jgi:hypothetical protein
MAYRKTPHAVGFGESVQGEFVNTTFLEALIAPIEKDGPLRRQSASHVRASMSTI